jgi:DNA-binding LacI/PurR family transcriptional regulator
MGRVVEKAAARGKPVIAFLEPPDLANHPNCFGVSIDRDAMAQGMVAHLIAAGFRHMILLGTETDGIALAQPSLLPALAPRVAHAWQKEGRSFEFMASRENLSATSSIVFDEDELLARLRGAKGGAAVVGTRDVEAWEAQQVMRRRAPALAARCPVFGFFDTPWSRAGSPPFTTVSVDVPAMVSTGMKIMDSEKDGSVSLQRSWAIPPKLVVRAS